MEKISIAMYSTLEGNSYKGNILEPLIESIQERGYLSNVYGLKNIQTKKKYNNKNIHVSIIPIFASSLMARVSRIFKLPSYYAYRLGEIVTGIVFVLLMMKDPCVVIILKPRPHVLVKLSALKKKQIIIDSGEMHPRYYQKECIREYKKYGLRHKSIFADERAVKQIENSLEKADIVIALSRESFSSYLNYGIPREKLVCFNLGTDPKLPRRIRLYDETKNTIFFITAHHSILKGTHRVINAWINSKKTYKSELIIIGSIHDDLKEYLNKIVCPSNIKFVGSLDRDAIIALYDKYNSVGILNSFSEGYPRSVAEYLQNGMPVIVSKVSTCDVIEHESHGFIVDPEDEASLQSYIEKFIEDAQYYKNFAYNIGNLKLPIIKDYVNNISTLLIGEC